MDTKECIVCGKLFELERDKNNKLKQRKTCSNKCAKELNKINRMKQCNDDINQREDSFIEKFNTKFAGRFEYIEGYKNCESIISCRCLACGTIKTVTAQCVRKNRTTVVVCKVCYQKEREYERQEQIKKRQQEQEDRRRLRELKTKEHEKKLQKICIECGKEFKANTIGAKICSDVCRRKRNNRLREIHRRNKLKENGIVDYTISLTRLIKRDKGICKLCGRKVDTKDYEIKNNAFIAKKAYPSIDHIVPVSKGGMHTWDNVQLAHHKCNSIKRDCLEIPKGRQAGLTR